MKIVAISDMHGNLIDIPECDVLCIAGDIIGLNDQWDMVRSEHWFRTRFVKWINNSKAKLILATPGNHDKFISLCYEGGDQLNLNTLKSIEDLTNGKLKFLIDETYEYNGYKFYGLPWIAPIPFQEGKWCFEDGSLHKRSIPKDIDVLISHDNPYKNIGLYTISNHIPYHVYGHWHNDEHHIHDRFKNNRYNCAILNDYYNLKKIGEYLVTFTLPDIDIDDLLDDIEMDTRIQRDYIFGKIKSIEDTKIALESYIDRLNNAWK